MHLPTYCWQQVSRCLSSCVQTNETALPNISVTKYQNFEGSYHNNRTGHCAINTRRAESTSSHVWLKIQFSQNGVYRLLDLH